MSMKSNNIFRWNANPPKRNNVPTFGRLIPVEFRGGGLTDRIYILLFIGLVLIFFYPFILFCKIPIPADTVVCMYHPWLDVVWDNFASGVPFKNFLITDPVRQQYVWRNLAIRELKQGQMPV